jgi:hypothetical protein
VTQDGLYCSASYDPTTHFETTIAEVLELDKQITRDPVNVETDADQRIATLIQKSEQMRVFKK